MAKLQEQRDLIRELSNFHLNEGNYSQSTLSLLGIRLGSLEEVHVLAYLLTRPILLSDRDKDINAMQTDSSKYADRSFKIGNLYKSCKDAGFIEPHIIDIPDTTNLGKVTQANVGISVTDRGSDLLNFLGFWKIFFEKYSKLFAFFWGAVSTVFIGSIGWILTHLEQVKMFIAWVRS